LWIEFVLSWVDFKWAGSESHGYLQLRVDSALSWVDFQWPRSDYTCGCALNLFWAGLISSGLDLSCIDTCGCGLNISWAKLIPSWLDLTCIQ
jgi:hypothetical protein